jgi:O-antigen/teichoic acid export membrane protein
VVPSPGAGPCTTPALPADPGEPATARLRRGFAVFASNHGAALVVSLAASALLVRLGGQADVASYLLLVQGISSLSYVLQLGLAPAALRFAPLARGAGGQRTTAALRRRLLGVQAVIWAAVLPALVLAWPTLTRLVDAPELAGVGPEVAGGAVLASLVVVGAAYLRAFHRYATAAVIGQLLVRVLTLAAFFALLVAGVAPVSWTSLLAAFLAAQALTALATAVALRRTTRLEEDAPRPALPPPAAGPLGRFIVVTGARNLTSILLVSADLWILSALRSHEEVAVYGMMIRLLQLVVVSNLVASLVVPQEFSVLEEAGRRRELERLARSAATAATAIAAVAALALVLAGRPLIALAFGPEYVAGWGILLVLIAGQLANTVTGPAGFLLQMTGHHVALLGSTALAALLAVGTSVLLAPAWGGYGVAAGVSLGFTALAILNVLTVWQRLGVRSWAYASPRAWRQLAAAAVGRSGAAG